MMYGGCECWMDDMCNVDEVVPAGCEHCGEDAAIACGIDIEESSMEDDDEGNNTSDRRVKVTFF